MSFMQGILKVNWFNDQASRERFRIYGDVVITLVNVCIYAGLIWYMWNKGRSLPQLEDAKGKARNPMSGPCKTMAMAGTFLSMDGTYRVLTLTGLVSRANGAAMHQLTFLATWVGVVLMITALVKFVNQMKEANNPGSSGKGGGAMACEGGV